MTDIECDPRNLKVEDSNWSLSYLRYRFLQVGEEFLFGTYRLRLNFIFFRVYLLLQLFLSSFTLIYLSFVHIHEKGFICESISNVKWIAKSIDSIIMMVVISTLLLINRKERYFERLKRFHNYMSFTILVPTVGIPLILSVILSKLEPPNIEIQHGSFVFFLLSAYVFLPITSNLYLVLVAIVASVGFLVLSLYNYVLMEKDFQWIILKSASDLLLLLAYNLAGIYARYTQEIIFRKLFLNRKKNMEAQIKSDNAKLEEEELLLSILPPQLMLQVKEDYRSYLYSNQKLNSHQLFRNRYLKQHEDVSILYADIVNFTSMTSKLPVDKLIEALNDLFNKFDEAAEEHNCLRIKILGDCYYCVSGIPEQNPNHANNSINMGLQMIQIIGTVRESSAVDIDMRIGVHSGVALAGIIGLLKFQYDVWGDDVTLANRMEQLGKAGCVHITSATLNYLTEDEFIIEPYLNRKQDSLIDQQNEQTFLIKTKKQNLIKRKSKVCFSDEDFSNRQDKNSCSLSVKKSQGLPNEEEINLLYQESMKKDIQTMPLKTKDLWFKTADINPVFMFFSLKKWNVLFIKEKDNLFRYYLLFCFGINIILMSIQMFLMPGFSNGLLFGIFNLLVLTFSLIPFAFHGQRTEHCQQPSRVLYKFRIQMSNAAEYVNQNCILRMSLFALIILLLLSMVIVNLLDCNRIIKEEEERSTHTIQVMTSLMTSSPKETTFGKEKNQSLFYTFVSHKEFDVPPICCDPWNLTQCCCLVLLACWSFVRVFFLVKMFAYLFVTFLYGLFILSFTAEIFSPVGLQEGCSLVLVEDTNISSQWCHLALLLTLALTLHIVDRQIEYFLRLNFQWKENLKFDQEELEKTRHVNKTLLENIMPRHVATFFLNRATTDTLYHERHDWVAVIFASIPNYSDFAKENKLEEEDGQKMMQVLNAIIIDFDDLKAKPQFNDIEKIKIIGSTYMAACGLQLTLNSQSDEGDVIEERKSHVVHTMALFAAAMMKKLDNVNKESWQNFGLRIGIDVGPVIAGVLGILKPHYDIWGNSVNVASRMDSNGQIGKIHVTKDVSETLQEKGWKVEDRGEIFIKGKGQMRTYFVDPPSDPGSQDDFEII